MQPINRKTSEQIKAGMTESEVEAILGGPPGNYASKKVQWEEGFGESMRSWWHVKEWVGDEGMIIARFGHATGKVVSVEFREACLLRKELLKRVRSWLQWPPGNKIAVRQ